jgi:hypothetical protein
MDMRSVLGDSVLALCLIFFIDFSMVMEYFKPLPKLVPIFAEHYVITFFLYLGLFRISFLLYKNRSSILLLTQKIQTVAFSKFDFPLVIFGIYLLLLNPPTIRIYSFHFSYGDIFQFFEQLHVSTGSRVLVYMVQIILLVSMIQLFIFIKRVVGKLNLQTMIVSFLKFSLPLRSFVLIIMGWTFIKFLTQFGLTTASFFFRHYILSSLLLAVVYIIRRKYSYKDPYSFQDKTNVFGDDVTRLNRTEIDKIFFVRNEKDIQDVLLEAKKKGKHVCLRGQKHSMGGLKILF